MTRRINYEDDLFSLALQVRCLGDVLKLEIDPEFFRERIVGDIAWLDATIGRVYQGLRAGPAFVGRQDHLRELQRLKQAFAEALVGIVQKRAPFAVHLADRLEGIQEIRDAHLRDAAEIRGLLAAGATGPQEEEHMVSAEELKILFTPPEEEP
jgi:hypothetical protein